MEAVYTYRTIKSVSGEVVFKDRNSKFIAYAYPIKKEEEVLPIIINLKEIHRKARHWCYAWKLSIGDDLYRVNDDGEPNNSAGQPIYGQLISFNVTNLLIVVVRYFGGTKLGVGGLINAYRTAAKMALENSVIVEKTLADYYMLSFQYADMNKVMRLLKANKIEITHKEMELNCKIEVLISRETKNKLLDKIKNLHSVKISQKINN